MFLNHTAVRLQSVDAFRLLAAFFVIIIHEEPFTDAHGLRALDLAGVVDQVARFAVPFFFTISGYFWGRKLRRGADPLHLALSTSKRIATIFVFWSAVYLLPFDTQNYSMIGMIKSSYWHAA